MDENNSKPKRKDELTCVQLSKDTKAKLDKLGMKSDTYESIILKMMDSPCSKNKGESEVEPDD
jgi:hypothetical protein